MLPRPPIGEALRPGRHGQPEGPPGVTVKELASLAAAHVALRGNQTQPLAERLHASHGLDLPRRPGRSAAGSLALLWLGPGQWLALDDARAGLARFAFAPDLAAALDGVATVTDLTGARAVLQLSGPAATETLRRLVPVDVDADAFGADAAALTLAGHVGVLLWRLPASVPTYAIACYRSFGPDLANALLAAAAPFGCEVQQPG